MNLSNPSSQEFNAYLSDQLLEKEKKDFEQRLKEDKEFANSFKQHQQILEGMTNARRAYFQLYRDIEGEQPFSKSNQKTAPWYLWILIVLILGMAVWAIFELF